jgi:hypothetical protein
MKMRTYAIHRKNALPPLRAEGMSAIGGGWFALNSDGNQVTAQASSTSPSSRGGSYAY